MAVGLPNLPERTIDPWQTVSASAYVSLSFTTPPVSLFLFSQGVTIHRPVIYGNTATVLTPAEKELAPEGHTHRWTVAVRGAASTPDSDIVGGADDLGYFIKRVTFKLHETYANPSRSAFPLTTCAHRN